MKKMKIMLAGLVLSMAGLGIVLTSCYMKTEHKIEAHITIDIREIEATGNQIEDMVRAKRAKKGQSLFILPWRVEPAYAEYQIKIMTPEVQKAIERRGARIDSLDEMMLMGCIGENNRGYVEYRSCPTCNQDPALKEKAEKLVTEENQDRLFIYKAMVEQNNLPADALSVVETTLGKIQRQKALAGTDIQQDDGSWVKK